MTTTDIARIDHAVALLDTTNDNLARLAQWVEAARNAHQLVAPLVDTAFIPDAYKPKVPERATPEQKEAAYKVAVANATAAVLQGLSLGLDPLVSLQQIYIVHGRPGMYAKLMVALIQSRGHEVWTEDLSDSRAVVCGRRKGGENIERVVITMDQARKAGWTRNDNYAKTPQDMLWARAASRVCDRIASDVLKGIASVEEIEDTIHAEATVGSGSRTVSPPRRRAAAAALPATVGRAEDPPLDPAGPWPADDGTATESSGDGAGEASVTPAQLKKLHTMLGKAGYGDRDEGLAYLSQEVGRDIASSKDLTRREAVQLIDTLEQARTEPAVGEPELLPLDPSEASDGDQ